MAGRRPAGHFLDLDQIKHLSDTAWDLAQIDRRAWGNALRVQVQMVTGLRVAELHALRPSDLNPNGTITVRRGKGCKPRRTVFLDGRQSPTRDLLERYIAGEGRARGNDKTTPNPCAPEEPIFLTQPRAYSHWVSRRLGPASGLQRRITLLNASTDTPPNRYLIRTHLFRACFVIIARRLPRTIGKRPIEWETIAYWLGHESTDMTKKCYWYADEDEALEELAQSIPPHTLPSTPTHFTPWSERQEAD